MFATGETNDYPLEFSPLLARRVLWQQYGIDFADFDFQDILKALRLHNLEQRREKYQADKLNKNS